MDATGWMGLVITTVGVAASGLLLFLDRGRRAAKATARNPSAPDGVLAHGEATGHAHRLDLSAADVFVDAQGTIFCRTRDGARLTHEEHGPITLPAGFTRTLHLLVFLETWPDEKGPLCQSGHWVIDLADTDYIGSVGNGALVHIYGEAEGPARR